MCSHKRSELNQDQAYSNSHERESSTLRPAEGFTEVQFCNQGDPQHTRSKMDCGHLCAGKTSRPQRTEKTFRMYSGKTRSQLTAKAVKKFHDLNFRWPIHPKDISRPAVSSISGTRIIFTYEPFIRNFLLKC